MGLWQAAKSAHERTIQASPVSVVIHRVEQVPQDGGFARVETTLPPQTVRLFRDRQTPLEEIVSTQGVIEQSRRWALLAYEAADIRAGERVRDTFEVPGLGRFEVEEVVPIVVETHLIGYEATVTLR